MTTWSETNYKNVSDNVIKRVDNYPGLSREWRKEQREERPSGDDWGDQESVCREKNRRKGNIYERMVSSFIPVF